MVDFVIIDDEEEIRNTVKCVIENTFKSKIEYMIISEATITKDVEDMIKIERKNTVFILDIELNNDHDGIEIASIIRNSRCKRHEIIFLTGYVDYAFNVLNYKINPIAFIKKDENFKDILRTSLIDAVKKVNKIPVENKITVKKGTSEITLKENDIIFAQKNKGAKSLNIVTKLYAVDVIETIENFAKKVSACFIKIDRSTIINHKNIKFVDVNGRIITMSNEEIFYVDSKTIKKVMEFDISDS